MKKSTRRSLMFVGGVFACLLPGIAQAGHVVQPAESKTVEAPVRNWFPDEPRGNVTLGVAFSEKLSGGYIDTITGIWAPKERDALVFLNSRYHLEDDGQFIASTGLGYRKLLADKQIIFGANAYWDAVNSEHGNDFNQLGLGVELLSHWVDARFNYYLPEDDRFEINRRTVVHHGVRQHFSKYEGTLQGFNAEVGFLVPGLDRFTEVRIFGGYYHYDNPFGGDFQGFKARLEAHLLPGLVAEVEYWDDAELMGGHWTAGARVSVPFSIYNLTHGRNPFEGIGEYFTPRQRKFEERMGDMVIRSHRIQTATSGDILTGESTLPTVSVQSKSPDAVVIGGLPFE